MRYTIPIMCTLTADLSFTYRSQGLVDYAL